MCEEGGDWAADGVALQRRPRHQPGQLGSPTGAGEFAPEGAMATEDQQIMVAERIQPTRPTRTAATVGSRRRCGADPGPAPCRRGSTRYRALRRRPDMSAYRGPCPGVRFGPPRRAAGWRRLTVSPGPAGTVLGLTGAILLLLSAGIHLHLWSTGYRHIRTIGPVFMLHGVVGIGLTVAVTRRAWAALAGAAFASTIGGLLISVEVGLSGFRDSFSAPYATSSLLVESAAVAVLAVAGLVTTAPKTTPLSPPLPLASAWGEQPQTHRDRPSSRLGEGSGQGYRSDVLRRNRDGRHRHLRDSSEGSPRYRSTVRSVVLDGGPTSGVADPTTATELRPRRRVSSPQRATQILRTWLACRPFWPCFVSNSTRWPSARSRKPSIWISDWWTKRSSPPPSGVMKPKPFSALNHLTAPTPITVTP